MNKLYLLLFSLIVCYLQGSGQIIKNDLAINKDSVYLNWYNKSPKDDSVYGAAVDKAYEQLLKNKESVTVIVAVIDGGIDINHEDLKENIWINNNEIPNNGIDDDSNGYIDDINGWNFIGNAQGENITYENLESTRIYRQLKDKYEDVDPKSVSEELETEYKLYLGAKNKYLKEKKQATKDKADIKMFRESYLAAKVKLEWYLDTNVITLSALKNIKSEDKFLMHRVNFLKFIFENDFEEELIAEMKKESEERLEYHLNMDFNPRTIIGDDPNDIEQTYGNNNVYGPESDHGTFVAGIISAKRNNDIGIDGIADNVKIMALKAVPNGDERDKDIAKAIRYAVDNGARVINMSFGKDFSPQKQLVDKAIKYAEEKNVLIVHAAGNDALNLDKTIQYPTNKLSNEIYANNWITVGASSDTIDLEFAAEFTNYGKTSVDIFAPGVNIKSLKPENKYDIADGTSFSSPVVSGVAALILSYFPELSAIDTKNIILNSVYDCSNVKVQLPDESFGKSKKTKFKKLSAKAGIVNAYNAILMANDIVK